MPKADYIFKEDDQIVVIGRSMEVLKFTDNI
jgi:hypothetical protein